MLTIQTCPSSLYAQPTLSYQFSRHSNYFSPFPTAAVLKKKHPARTASLIFGAKQNHGQYVQKEIKEEQTNADDYDSDARDYDSDYRNGFSSRSRYRRRDEERNYDKDLEFAEILGSCLDNPKKAQSKMEERLKKKRNKVLHTKTSSAIPMKVTFNKRPNYDAIQGANVNPTTFYNIRDFEIQDNLALIRVDIGTTEPLLLDVLINALMQISADYIGIKQLVFGGSEFENWKENLTSDDAGCSVQKI